MAGGFQPSAFQFNAFQTGLDITSTGVLLLPIDCVLIGDQPAEGQREYEIHIPRIKTKTSLSGAGAVVDSPSSFTSKTGSRGYD